MSAVGERGSETTTGNKSVEASNDENKRGNTGTIPKTVSSCIAIQTDASLQADRPYKSHDIRQRAVRLLLGFFNVLIFIVAGFTVFAKKS